MSAWLSLAVIFLCFQASVCEADDTSSAGNGTPMYVIGGVLLLISLVVLVALCADAVEHHGIPAPSWSNVLQIDNATNTGLTGLSDGMRNVDANTVQRVRVGHFEADGARWGAPLKKGKHLFEIYWPKATRNTLASVGVGTIDAPLMVKPRDSLVGCNAQTWGLDIARYKCLHKGQPVADMPKNKVVPDTFLMYVDCDSGTVGFGTEHSYWGAPLNIPQNKFPVYPMIGTVQQYAQITMKYKGSSLNTVGDTGYGAQGQNVMTTGKH